MAFDTIYYGIFAIVLLLMTIATWCSYFAMLLFKWKW